MTRANNGTDMKIEVRTLFPDGQITQGRTIRTIPTRIMI